MRTFLAFLTLGAGGVGYLYLQPSLAPGEPYNSVAASETAPRADWGNVGGQNDRPSRVPVKDLVGQIHERTRTVLDRFTNQYGGHSDAPDEDAFQRLQQATRSIVVAASNQSETTSRGSNSDFKPSPLHFPDVGELQRIAFELESTTAVNKEEKPPEAAPQTAASDSDELITPFSMVVKEEASPAVAQQESKKQESKKQESTLDPTLSLQQTEKPVSRSTVDGKKAPLSNAITRKRVVDQPIEASWKVVGKSTEGRPMHSMHLGSGGVRTLIIAGLNGEDRTAVRWLELVADEFKNRLDLMEGNEIVFFRAGNPDGLVHNTRNNSRDVALNRSFPGRRNPPVSDSSPFNAPSAAVETRVMLDTLKTFRPRRLIHLMSVNGRSTVLYNKSAKNLANELERSAELKIQPLETDQLAGSIEDFADGTLDAAVLSLRIDTEKDWQRAWMMLKPHLVAAVVGQSIEVVRGDAVQNADADRTPIPYSKTEPVSRSPRRKGYEELPPPPRN